MSDSPYKVIYRTVGFFFPEVIIQLICLTPKYVCNAKILYREKERHTVF